MSAGTVRKAVRTVCTAGAARIVEGTSGFHRAGKPYVTADDAVITHICIAAENGGIGVDNHVVSDVGMALDALDGIAVIVQFKGFCTKGNALIELDMFAYDGGFTDNNTGAMVDKE